MASGPITSWQIDGETMETVTDFIFLGSKITADGDCSHEIKRHLLLGRKAMANLDSVLKSKDITNKGPSSQSYDFSSSHVWMWELDHKESWGPKNWCFWTVVLEKTLKSSLDSKEIKPVNCKGNQCWIFTEGAMPKLQYFSTWWEELTHWKRVRKDLVVWLSACVCMCTLRSRISSLGNRHFLLQSSFWAAGKEDEMVE